MGTEQAALNMRALEVATDAKAKAEGVINDIDRLDRHLAAMRSENMEYREAFAKKMFHGLDGVHRRMDKFLWVFITACGGGIATGLIYMFEVHK